LGSCRGLTVLATSREPLGGPNEQVFPIPPLGMAEAPAGHDHPSDEATELCIERAVTVNPVYELTASNAAAVQSICARLDGLPLAIELAACWIRILSPEDLLGEIGKSMEVLTSDSAVVAGRHRSLHAVLAGSWQWLAESERRVLSALGVFAGGFTREAAQAVSGASLASLAALVERSFIQRLPDATGGTRYHVHELVRGYALERLEDAGQSVAADVRSRHLDVFLTLQAYGFPGSGTSPRPTSAASHGLGDNSPIRSGTTTVRPAAAGPQRRHCSRPSRASTS
jgi:predicted ATPase